MRRRERHPVTATVYPPVRRRSTAHRLLMAGLGVVLLLGAVTLGTAVVAISMLPRTASIPGAVSTPQSIPLPDRGATAGLSHSEPVRVSVPRVHIDTALTKVDLAADGTLNVPPNDHVAGWYSKGPAPGDAGGPPAVIAGHVDSYLGPAVFFTLRQIRPKDTVVVRRADGSTATFVVYRVAQFDKTKFPADQVYAPSPRAELRLITCSGDFDYDTRSYLSDFVVYAALEPPAPATPAPSASPTSGPTSTPTAGPASAPDADTDAAADSNTDADSGAGSDANSGTGSDADSGADPAPGGAAG